MLAALWSNDLFFIFLRFSVSLYNWTIQKRICRVLSPTGLIKNSWSFAVGFVIRGGKSWSLWKCWPKLPKCLCRLDQRDGSVRPGREADASPHIWVCFFSWILSLIIYLFIIAIIISSIYREADASPHICSFYYFLNIIIHKYLLIHYRCYHFYYLSGGRCISSYLQLLFLYLSKSNCSFFSFELLCGKKNHHE